MSYLLLIEWGLFGMMMMMMMKIMNKLKKILKRANKILENTGNSIIGNPLLFPIDALSVLKQDDSEMAIHYQKILIILNSS